MYRKDQIRVGVALVLLLIILVSYFSTNSKEFAGYAAIFSLLVWLGLIYFLRKDN